MQLLKAETRKEVARRLVYYLSQAATAILLAAHFDGNATRRYRLGEL